MTEWTDSGLCSLANAVDAFATRDIEYTPAAEDPPPNPESRLLRLPRELRDQIYSLVLVEPPYWYKLHHPSCPVNLNREALRNPIPSSIIAWFKYRRPANTSTTAAAATSSPALISTACACGKRTGLALRLACRQTYVETAAVFYGGNAFFFRDAQALSRWIRRLPPAARALVRHVCVLHHHRRTSRTPPPPPSPPLRRSLALLTGLRELYVDERILRDDPLLTAAAAGADDSEEGEEERPPPLPPLLRRLRRLRRLRAVNHTFYRAAATVRWGDPLPMWEVRDVRLADDDGGGGQQRVVVQDADGRFGVASINATRRFLEELLPAGFPRPTAARGAWDGPVRVELPVGRGKWDEAWLFDVPLAEGAVEALRERERGEGMGEEGVSRQ